MMREWLGDRVLNFHVYKDVAPLKPKKDNGTLICFSVISTSTGCDNRKLTRNGGSDNRKLITLTLNTPETKGDYYQEPEAKLCIEVASPIDNNLLAANGAALPERFRWEGRDNRGIFVTGNGTRGSSKDASARGDSSFRNMGITAGVDYRFTRNPAVGLMGGYGRTRNRGGNLRGKLRITDENEG